MDNGQIADQIQFIGNKGCCHHSLYRAQGALLKLKPHIEEKDYFELNLALEHFETGEGATELFDVTKRLVNKYIPY